MTCPNDSEPELHQDLAVAQHGIRCGVSLQELNTFGFSARAEYFAIAQSDQHLIDILNLARRRNWSVFVLGGGSNLLLTRNISGLVLCLGDKQISYNTQPDGRVHVTAGAGTNWHELVMDTLDRGYGGLENLSLIPGTVGAAPVQNIGAYGVELVDRLVSLRAWHVTRREFITLQRDECDFAYRDSRLKREPGDWIVVSVTLAIGGDTPLITHYASLAERLSNMSNRTTTSMDARTVSDAVIALRQERLPDPAKIGNAGSFFHNPIVSAAHFSSLAAEHHGIVSYPMPDGRVKLAAGWLIDRLGYRGVRRGAVGVHQDQALVLVHTGGGTGSDMLGLVEEIRAAVHAAYEVELTVEPLVV